MQAVGDPVLRQVEDDDGALAQQRPADAGHQVLPPLRPVPPKTSSRVMSSCAATCSHRGAAAIRSASDSRPGGLAPLVLGQLGRVLDGLLLGLARAAGWRRAGGARPSSTTGSQQQSASAAPTPQNQVRCGDRARRGRRGRARAGRRRSAAASTAPARRARRAGPPPSRESGSGTRRRRCRVLTRPQPRFVGNPAKVQPHTWRLEPEPPRIKFDVYQIVSNPSAGRTTP